MAYGVAGTAITGSPPACRVFHSTTQSLPHASVTQLAFDSERFDTDTMHATATNNGRITFNTAGIYLVTAMLQFATSTSGNRRAALLQLNGTSTIAQAEARFSVSGECYLQVSSLWKFAVNDWVGAYGFQDTGSSMTLPSTSGISPEFSAVWVGLGT